MHLLPTTRMHLTIPTHDYPELLTSIFALDYKETQPECFADDFSTPLRAFGSTNWWKNWTKPNQYNVDLFLKQQPLITNSKNLRWKIYFFQCSSQHYLLNFWLYQSRRTSVKNFVKISLPEGLDKSLHKTLPILNNSRKLSFCRVLANPFIWASPIEIFQFRDVHNKCFIGNDFLKKSIKSAKVKLNFRKKRQYHFLTKTRC